VDAKTFDLRVNSFAPQVKRYSREVKRYLPHRKRYSAKVNSFVRREKRLAPEAKSFFQSSLSFVYAPIQTSITTESLPSHPMSTSSSPSSNRKSKGLPPRPLLTALLSLVRWKILAEMATGDLFTVKELARLVDDTEASVSKHLQVLRKAGITKFSHIRLHQIVDAYRLAPDSPREIDFGHLVAKLPDRAK
jgi:hypothetical protein